MKSPATLLSEQKASKETVARVGREIVWKCRLLEFRNRLNLTLRDIESKTRITSASLSQIEHGADLRLRSATKIAKFFGCRIEELWPEMIGEES